MARMINHIDLTVTNLARTRTFYEPIMKLLGYEISGESAHDLVFSPADGKPGPSIALHLASPDSSHKKHDRYAPGLHHLAFDAFSRDEVDGLYEVLKELGAEILDPPAVYYEPDYYALFFLDPDGLKLEIAHAPSSQSSMPGSANVAD